MGSPPKNVKMGHHKGMTVSAFRNNSSGDTQSLVLVHNRLIRPAKATCDTLISHCYVGESRLSAAVSPEHSRVCN